MKHLISFLIISLFFIGCAKTEPVIITKTEFKEVLVPIRCGEMPTKPNNDGSKQAAKALMIYLKTCEEMLAGCVGGK
ncbi:hypothetical protein CCAL9344_07900 [Campylobacter sp. RM9344]|uniref:Lipoprotein n=1 Tax=Campylobacter californiensis TaxID=1032243 RepID=A0AAW3ZWZ8_9BACT|nr:hypothetical protein [Campylobacter sp. RM9337]MBE3030100.1 hypothetical protein [Campylobacter sp. RM9344]MBE3608781.1 hypothetical protein [Campylobacter sp. RM9337]